MKQRASSSQNRLHLGRVKGSLWRKEELTEGQLNHHVHVVGASGYGKTVFLSHIVRQRIEQGAGLLFIDLKADMDTILKFTQYAAQADRLDDLKIMSLTDMKVSAPYNLIANGTATQIRDRIMLSLNWSEEFYRNQAASFLLKVLIGLCWLRDRQTRPLHLGELHRIVSNRTYLGDVCGLLPLEAARERDIFQEAVLFASNADNWNSLQGLRTQLESIVLSDFGDLFSSSEDGIDLFEAAHGSKLVYLFLDTRRYGETAKSVGRFILQDLKSVSARIDAEVPKVDRKPFTILIDEFADLAQEDFIGFLDRARSSRMSVVVSHQEICDLQRISPEFAGRLMGNTSTLYAFLQKRPESAELIAGVAGTQPLTEETVQTNRTLFVDWSTGMKSRKTVEGFVIHPNVVKRLRVGSCVCVKKYPEARAYLVEVPQQQ